MLDAIVNSRLYAATFDTLNDPMGGRYYYFGGDVSSEFRRAIFESRQRRRICSLSKTRRNTLLRSYYGGHKGIALGVRLQSSKYPQLAIRDVNYDNVICVHGKAANRSADAAALDILTQKQTEWKHEKEVRIFTDKSHVSVSVAELVLGCLIDSADEQLVMRSPANGNREYASRN